MADSSVLLEVIVEGKNIKLVQRDVESLGASINKTSKETKENTKNTKEGAKQNDRYSKGMKGVAGATSNGTKAFSKMRGEMGGSGGLVAAYATLAANVFAISAAFGVLQRAAAVEQLTQGITVLGQTSGIAMKSLSNGLKEATGDAIALEEAMRSTSMVIGAGFDSSTLERLGTVAKNASIALGRDTADSLARLTRGAVKLEPELLDELGIMVRLDDATSEYAKTVGKSANDLTSFERRQAFMNAVLAEGEEKFSALGDSVETNPYDRLAAAFNDLSKSLLSFANNTAGISKLVGVLADNSTLLLGVLISLGRGAITASIGALAPVLTTLGDKLSNSANSAAKLSVQKAKLSAESISGTKTVTNYANALAKGEQNTKQFNSAMRFGNQSLNSRIGFLKEHVKANGLFNQTTKDKVIGVRGAAKAVDGLAMAEYRATVASKQFKEQLIFSDLAAGNFRNAFTRLTNQFSRYNKAAKIAAANSTMLGKGFIFAANAGKILGLSLRFIGGAMLAVLPYIGLIVLAIGLVKEGLNALYKRFYETESLKEFTEQSKKTIEVLDELSGSFDKIKNNKLFSDQVIAEATALNQIFSETNKFLEAYQALDVEPLSDRIFGKLDDLVAGIEKYKMFMGILGPIYSAIFKGARGVAESFSETRNAVESAQKTIDASDKLSNSFARLYPNAKNLFEVVFVDGRLNAEKLAEVMKLLKEDVLDTANALDLVAKSTKAGSAAFKEYLTKFVPKTEFDGVTAAADDLYKSLAGAAAEDPQKVYQLISELSLAEQAFYGVKKAGDDFVSLKFDTFDDFLKAAVKGAEIRAKQISDDRQTLATEKARMGIAKSNLDLEKQKTIYSGQYNNIASLQNKVADEQLTTLQAQERSKQRILDSLRAEGKDNLQTRILEGEILDLQKQQAVVKASKIDAQEKEIEKQKENVSLLQMQQKYTKTLLDVQQKMVSAQESMISSRRTLLELEMKAANRADPTRGRDTSLTASQEYQITKELEAERINAASSAFNIKVKQIEMEYDLIEAQYKLLKAEAANINAKAKEAGKPAPIDTTFLDRAIADLPAAQTAALQAAGAEFIATYRRIIEETADDADKAITASITNSGSQLERIRAMFSEGGAGDPNSDATAQEKIAGMMNVLGPQLDELKSLGPQGELVAAITEGSFAIADSFAMIGDSSLSMADKIAAVGGVVGSLRGIFAAQSKAAIASIDAQIAAEQKRDGKSKESLAKIAAMEAKKEAMKKKQFEKDKKMKMAEIVINTAAAIMGLWSGIKDPYVGPVLAGMQMALVTALGAAQLAVVSGTSYQGGGGIGSAPSTPSVVSAGQRKSTVDLARTKSASGELGYLRGEMGTGGPENFTPAFMGAKYRAQGGATTGYVVGEQGPELFVPETSGRIIPNEEATSAPVQNVNFSINAIDSRGVEQVLLEQRGNIIGMLRESANSYGNGFFEEVELGLYTPSATGANRA